MNKRNNNTLSNCLKSFVILVVLLLAACAVQRPYFPEEPYGKDDDKKNIA